MKKIRSMSTTSTVIDAENNEPVETSVTSEVKQVRHVRIKKKKNSDGRK